MHESYIIIMSHYYFIGWFRRSVELADKEYYKCIQHLLGFECIILNKAGMDLYS